MAGDPLFPAASWWRVERWLLSLTTAGESSTLVIFRQFPSSPDSSGLRNFLENHGDFGNGDVHMYRAYICMRGDGQYTKVRPRIRRRNSASSATILCPSALGNRSSGCSNDSERGGDKREDPSVTGILVFFPRRIRGPLY